MPKARIAFIVWLCISILELLFEVVYLFNQNRWGIYVFKPLLMPALAYLFWKSLPKGGFTHPVAKILFVSLFFSMLGDIFLMFLREELFIAGLLSFLVAHVLYIVAFWKENKGFAESRWVTILTRYMILLFPAALLFAEMQSNLKELFVPVIVYTLVIISMGVWAWMRREYQSLQAYLLTFLGAICFIISDSTIAFNKFISPFQGANLAIMFTYILGQFLIISGMSKSGLFELKDK